MLIPSPPRNTHRGCFLFETLEPFLFPLFQLRRKFGVHGPKTQGDCTYIRKRLISQATGMQATTLGNNSENFRIQIMDEIGYSRFLSISLGFLWVAESPFEVAESSFGVAELTFKVLHRTHSRFFSISLDFSRFLIGIFISHTCCVIS